MQRNTINKYALAASLLLSPSLVHADAGLPMLILAMPIFALSIIPIVIIEAIYMHHYLSLPARVAGQASLMSNLISTLVGIPMTWILLAILQSWTGGDRAYGLDSTLGKIIAVTWQAPWLIPYEENFDWIIPIAGIVLLIPFYFASWYSEYLTLEKILHRIPSAKLKVCSRNANLITYGLMLLWPVLSLIIQKH